ncbi:glycoside hydrolase family 3 N-terminal domain-containing protein [Flavobacterium gilvum]|uniref:Glycosyl hydrolase n=1 Tax=Flavobacterium gilvum TaxID=1492737 RepID=A0AAC9I2J2_9FLAO|nr:glycoside hydrolase family 3 N-terminal domain-containing protein [Flavobacterium gilvum]AOW08795.1 glycosyl hydrolase [Flavobacterium gilvum]
MIKKNVWYATIAIVFMSQLSNAQQKDKIYKKGWIDFNKNGVMDVYENPKEPLEKRVNNLLSQMNLNEKTCQMVTLYGYKRVLNDSLPTSKWKNEIWKDGIANIDEQLNGVGKGGSLSKNLIFPFSNHAEAINTIQRWFIEETRLGIPVDFTNEGIHGLNHTKATPFPAPIGIGSTWNKKLVLQAGQIAGREAKALGYTNVYTPILDLARDPRWGRVLETYGEDPYLVGALGTQMVNGIQSQGVASTLKHYAVYSIPKGGRDGTVRTDPHVNPRELQEIHLYPFKKVIHDAQPMGVMASYNDWNGEPIISSHYFLTELLRWEFGFNGYVVSDSDAAEYPFTKHQTAPTYEDAIRQVVEAGLDVRTNFWQPSTYLLPLRKLVNEGRLSINIINERVAEVLRVKFRLGLFDSPYVLDTKNADKIVGADKNQDFVLDIQKQSLVLLKNEGNLLPLDKNKIKKILVTGPLATEDNYMVSRYGPQELKNTTILDGIKEYLGKDVMVNYVKGCETIDANFPESEIIHFPMTAKEQSDIDAAVLEAKENDVIIVALGEDEKLTGEGKSRTSLDLSGRQQQLLEALYATGKPVVLVLINGQPLTINWANKFIPAILEAWFPNHLGGKAIAETLFGDYNPGGKLSVTFPKSTGQIEFNFPFKLASQGAQGGEEGPNGYGKTLVNGALYPFGYGLSYTTFSYSDLKVSPTKLNSQAEIKVSVNVTNTGKRSGDEVVQLYISDKYSSVVTYDSVLRGFERITLKPGETKTVNFTLQPSDLMLLDKNMKWTVEPGDFEIKIGSSSEDIKLKELITILP